MLGSSAPRSRSGIVWSDKHLYEYLVNPKKCLRGFRQRVVAKFRQTELERLSKTARKHISF